MLKLCGEQINWKNIPLEAVEVYRQKSFLKYLLFLVIAFAEMKPCIAIEKGCIMNYACSSLSIYKIRQKF